MDDLDLNVIDKSAPHSTETDMAKIPAIEELTGKQLQDLISKAAALQQERKAGRLQELRTKWTEEATEEGFTVQEVLGLRDGRAAKGKGGGTAPKAKYKLPDGGTWSGRGRVPLALRDALKGAKGWDAEAGTFEDSEAREKALEKFLL